MRISDWSSDVCSSDLARRGDQKEWSTSRKARLLRSSLQAGANRQGSDKIDQLAESVRANSDGHVGAFHLVEDQQPGGDHGSMLDERTFDRGIEPPRSWHLHPDTKPGANPPPGPDPRTERRR